ncbi:MAG: hypothetical protein COV99_02625 [Bacteroidetes bacterium CG12_big_fil_rev_8_21_14_0_65_60_17]|nr:MAG: hypothetical protein COV99_02625 [Bacteroidetes bacterium CG12_big_fil_rev_8_21_14_0_65_60_17]
MNDIRFVWFDLDDTLLDHKGAELLALEALVARHGTLFGDASLSDVRNAYARVNRQVWTEYAAGVRDKTSTKYGRFELLLLDVHPDGKENTVLLADEYLRLYASFWNWVEGAREALIRMAEHYPVGLMTNGFTEVQHAKLQRFPELSRACSHIVISEETGVLKPDVRIFRHAEELCGHTGEHVLYIGDSLSSDVTGGIGAGWYVAWFHGDDHPSPRVFSFRQWSDLLAKLLDV